MKAALSHRQTSSTAAAPATSVAMSAPLMTLGVLPSKSLAQLAASARLATGRSGDVHEREADRGAAVMGRGSPVGSVTPSAGATAQGDGPLAAGVPGSVLAPLVGRGTPLPSQHNAFYGRALGSGASGVTFHHGAAADRVTRDLGVGGLAVSGHVAVRSDRYDATRPDGGRTLRHEMVHAAQQQAAGVAAKPIVQMGPDDEMDESEDVPGSVESHQELSTPKAVRRKREREKPAVALMNSVDAEDRPGKRQKEPEPTGPVPIARATTLPAPGRAKRRFERTPSTADTYRAQPDRDDEEEKDEVAPAEDRQGRLKKAKSSRASAAPAAAAAVVAPPPVIDYGSLTLNNLFATNAGRIAFPKTPGALRPSAFVKNPLKHDDNAADFIRSIARSAKPKLRLPSGETVETRLELMLTSARRLDALIWTPALAARATTNPLDAAELTKSAFSDPVDYGDTVHGASDFIRAGLAALRDAKAIGDEQTYPYFPVLGPQTAQGMGTFAYINVTAGAVMPSGSAASGTETSTPWETHLDHRRWGVEGQNFYIRGHLLNDHCGGMSIPPNLVPLVGVRNNEGPYTNQLHEALVESQLKQALKALQTTQAETSKDRVARVIYRAEAMGRKSRPGRATVIEPAANRVKTLMTDLNLTTADSFGDFKAAARQAVHADSTKAPRWREVGQPLGALIGYGDEDPMSELIAGLEANSALWKYEDDNVPRSLRLLLRVDRGDGKTPGEPQYFNIDNTVPDAPWHMRYRKNATSRPGPVDDLSEGPEHRRGLAMGRVYLAKTRAHNGNFAAYLTAHRDHVASLHERGFGGAAGMPAIWRDPTKDQAKDLAAPMDDMTFTTRAATDPDPTAATLTGHEGWLKQVPPEALMAAGLHEPGMMHKPTADYADALHKLYASLPQPELMPSIPLFASPTAAGVGRAALLHVTRGQSLPEGSSAEGTSYDGLPWYTVLKHRGWRNGSKGAGFFYIRGHLLNDHLGGPSAPYNLVPFGGAANIGMAKINTEHEVAFESIAKSAIMEMDYQVRNPDLSGADDAIQAVTYTIKVSNGRQRHRGGTDVAEKASALFDRIGMASPNVQPEGKPAYHNPDKCIRVGRLEEDVLAADERGANWQDLYDGMKQIGAPSGFTPADMSKHLKANAALWAYEDANVPSAIDLTLNIKREGRALTTRYTLHNDLPDDPRHMMYRPKAT